MPKSSLLKAVSYFATGSSQTVSTISKSKSSKHHHHHHHHRRKKDRSDYTTAADDDDYDRYTDDFQEASSNGHDQFPIPVQSPYDKVTSWQDCNTVTNPTPATRSHQIVNVSYPDDSYISQSYYAPYPAAPSFSSAAMQGSYGYDTAYTSQQSHPYDVSSTSFNTNISTTTAPATKLANQASASPIAPYTASAPVPIPRQEPSPPPPERFKPLPHLGFMDDQGEDEVVVIYSSDEEEEKERRRKEYGRPTRRQAREQEESSRGRTRHRSFSPNYLP